MWRSTAALERRQVWLEFLSLLTAKACKGALEEAVGALERLSVAVVEVGWWDPAAVIKWHFCVCLFCRQFIHVQIIAKDYLVQLGNSDTKQIYVRMVKSRCEVSKFQT